MKEHQIDRTGWAPGPWDDEPNRVEWIDAQTGLDCLILRNHYGALCGYVGVPRSNPNYGKGYDEVDVNVHGGPTYAAACMDDGPVCHTPAPGREGDLWWIGFDCSHFMDKTPGMDALLSNLNAQHADLAEFHAREVYRDVDYVVAECAGLARQLA
jgi:hypothetical protein